MFQQFFEEKDIIHTSGQLASFNRRTYKVTRFLVPSLFYKKCLIIVTAPVTPHMPKHLVACMEILIGCDVRLKSIRKCEASLTDALLAIHYGCKKFQRPLSVTKNSAILSLYVESSYRNQGIATMLINTLVESSDIVVCNYNAASFDSELMYTHSPILRNELKEQTENNAANLKNHGWLMVPMEAMHHCYSMYAVIKGHDHS